MLDGERRGGPAAAAAAERRARLTSQLRSHVITWNKSMKKHCHHYCDGGKGGGGDTFLTCPTHLAHTVISAFPVHTHITNGFMWPFTEPSTMTCRLAAGGAGGLSTASGWALTWTVERTGTLRCSETGLRSLIGYWGMTKTPDVTLLQQETQTLSFNGTR